MGRERKILLHLEDDVDDAMLVERALRAAGVDAEVRVVENGEQAVNYFGEQALDENQSARHLPALILLDLNMPLMSGHQFLEWRLTQPAVKRIPAVVLSTSDAGNDLRQAYDAGANGYLVKPIQHREMVRMFADLNSFWLNWNRTP